MKPSGIAVIGIAARMPGCDNYKAFASALKEAQKHTDRQISGQRQEDIEHVFPGFEAAPMSYLDRVDLFDNNFFGISKGEANRMRPEQRLILEETVKCIHDAGYSLDELRGSSTGIFTSKVDSQFKLLFNQLRKSSMAELGQSMDATRVAYTLDLRGPSVIIDTTCSSSLVALHTACQNIKDGTCEYALVGGVSLWVIPENSVASSPILSQKRDCTAFDDSADGTLFGEGSVVVMLKSEEQAIRDGDHIHAVIEATHINHGGAQIANITAPSPNSQCDTISATWKKAGVHPKDIAFIETHGTGTILGDPIEIKGILSAIDKYGQTNENVKISLGALKSQFGHLDGTSGLAGLIKLILLGQNRSIPPLVSFKNLNKSIVQSPQLQFPTETITWPEEKPFGGVSSFGVSGTNAHALLRVEKFKQSNLQSKNALNVLLLNADSTSAIHDLRSKVINELKDISDEELIDFCATFNNLQQVRSEQFVATGRSKKELLDALQRNKESDVLNNIDGFIGNDSAFDSQTFTELLKYSSVLKEFYTNTLECFDVLNPKVERFSQLASFLQWFETIGLKINRFIVSGFGELVSEFVQGKLSISEVQRQMTEDFRPLSKENFTGFLEKYQSDTNQIFHLGSSGEMLDIILSVNGQKDLALYTNSTLDLISNLLQSVELKRANAFYGKPKNRVPITIDFFDRQRCWPKIDPPAKVEELKTLEKEEKPIGNASDVTKFIKSVWISILEEEDIKETEDFFDLGGTSLMGLDVLDELKLKFDVTLAYEDVFDFPTIEKLSERVLFLLNENKIEKEEEVQESGVSEDTRNQLYEDLLVSTQGKVYDEIDLDIVLLTGATGYLGIYLLEELLKTTSAQIYCVVRAESEEKGWRKLTNHYEYYLNKEIPKERLIIVTKDLLTEELPAISGLDAVYHSAALVSHYGKYEWSYATNTQLTKKIVDWAVDNQVKFFFQMSTSAVAGAAFKGADEYRYFETDGNIGQEFNGNIYPETKFLAEEYLRSVKGIRFKSFRIANISGNSKTGSFQKNVNENSSLLFLKDIVKVKAYPLSLLKGATNLNPVDFVARAVVKLSKMKDVPVDHFHINDNQVITFRQVIESIKRQGLTLSELSDQEFSEFMNKSIGSSSRNLPMIGILKNRRSHNHATVHFETRLTNQLLEQINCPWDYNKDAFLDQLIKKQMDNKFLNQEMQNNTNVQAPLI